MKTQHTLTDDLMNYEGPFDRNLQEGGGSSLLDHPSANRELYFSSYTPGEESGYLEPDDNEIAFENNLPAGGLNVYGEAGGGRIGNKREPATTDMAYIDSIGNRRVPLHRVTKQAWEAMVGEARRAGFQYPLLMPTSGYRSVQQQQVLWEDALKKYGSEAEARKMVAKPGGSPHHSGRAMDLHLGTRNNKESIPEQRTLPVYAWLRTNAHRFGFYPYEVEPWHWEHNPLPGQSTVAAPVSSATTKPFDVQKAITANERYGRQLRWIERIYEINDLLLKATGQSGMSLGPEAFAHAVVAWQQQRGFSPSECDGIIGPNTWKAMQAQLGEAQQPTPALSANGGSRSSATSASALPAWARDLIPLLNNYRGSYPLPFLLGWIQVESGGNLKTTTKLDERGYFQLHPAESKALGLDHRRLSDDREYSLQSGIRLVTYLSTRVDAIASNLSVDKGSEFYLSLVKLYHWLPGGVKAIFTLMARHNVKPSSWAELRQFVGERTEQIKDEMRARLGKVWDPLRGIQNVDKVLTHANRFRVALAASGLYQQETIFDGEADEDLKSMEYGYYG